MIRKSWCAWRAQWPNTRFGTKRMSASGSGRSRDSAAPPLQPNRLGNQHRSYGARGVHPLSYRPRRERTREGSLPFGQRIGPAGIPRETAQDDLLGDAECRSFSMSK